MEPLQKKKTLSFEINGKHYDHIDEVPPEFRDKVISLMRLDGRWKNDANIKVTFKGPGGLAEVLTEEPHGSSREKFLREAVLPNLHLMDAGTQAEVLRELGGDREKQRSTRRRVFMMVLYIALGGLILFGFWVMMNMIAAL